MEQQKKAQYSINSCGWLLLFVFYLQFLTGETLNLIWEKMFWGSVPQYVAIVCVQIFAVVIPCTVFLLLKNTKPTEILKTRKLNVPTGIVCFLIGVFAQPVAGLINSPVIMAMSKGGQVSPQLNIPQNFGGYLLGLLVVALIPAVFEELLMRGIVLHSTEKYGYRLSLAISSIWFALLHNSFENFLGMLFLGFVLCYAVWMTQSVYAGIIIHFSFNASALTMQYLGQPNIWVMWLYIIVSIFLFSVCLSAINRKLVRRYRSNRMFVYILKALLNLPVILIILGITMFHFCI